MSTTANHRAASPPAELLSPDGLGSSPEPDQKGSGPSDLGDALHGVLSSVSRAGRFSVASADGAVESACQALIRRVVGNAMSQPSAVGDRKELARALARRTTAPALGGATAVAMAAKLARRLGPLRFLARRTPMWLVAAGVPAVYASVTRGSDDVELVASHLVQRARSGGVEPDAERVRRAAVQLLTGGPVEPDVEPRHAPLVLDWLRRAVRSAMPFGGGVAVRNPGALAAAAAAVPAFRLGHPGVGSGPSLP